MVNNVSKISKKCHTVFEFFFKLRKNFLVAFLEWSLLFFSGKERCSDIYQAVETTNLNHFQPKQSHRKRWMPDLQNFRSTLKGN